MNNESLWWRKFPRNCIRDEKLDYIAYKLGPEKGCLALLFYTVAYCSADDDGVFDIDDGIIFSRQMHFGSPEDVQTVADLMEERKLITRLCPKSTKYILDWWIPVDQTVVRRAPSAEERRCEVLSKLRSELEVKSAADSMARQKRSRPATTEPPFFSPENDKKQESVVQKNLNDTFQKNVVQKDLNDTFPKNVVQTQTIQTIQTDITDRQDNTDYTDRKDTHTQKSAACGADAGTGPAPAPQAQCARTGTDKEDTRPQETQSAQYAQSPEDRQTGTAEPTGEDAKTYTASAEGCTASSGEAATPPAKSRTRGAEINKKIKMPESAVSELALTGVMRTETDWKCAEVLWKFALDKCTWGWEKDADSCRVELSAIQVIILRLRDMEEPKNPALIVLGQLLGQFDQFVCTQNGDTRNYFYGLQELPSNMLKKTVWPQIVAGARKILHPTQLSGHYWAEQCKKDEETVKKEAETYNVDGLKRQEFSERGINPDSPSAWQQLLASKALENRKDSG